MVSPRPLAHLDCGDPSHPREHPLEDHLTKVGEIAAGFASALGAEEWARLAGRWHDLGKYRSHFQKRIREENGINAHIESTGDQRRDHSTAGAIHAKEQLNAASLAIQLSIAGHHCGLGNAKDVDARLQGGTALYQEAIQQNPPAHLLAVPAGLPTPRWATDRFSREGQRRYELGTRMLFSALCDGDFLDTESFYDQTRSQARQRSASIESLHGQIMAHMDRLEAQAELTQVNRFRAELRAACLRRATHAPGIFSLTVPTGGGKTLLGMNFALAHARANNLERVVVAIPYTSIIEQTADVYRNVFVDFPDAIIEHHSALDPNTETFQNRISSENWDARIIVTTTVQLFESLFSNRPSACRKLHRLAGAVIILDEAQTLPPDLLAPTLDVLQELVQGYGASLVISTATQPAFRRVPGRKYGFSQIEELIPDSLNAFELLRRVEVTWPKEELKPTPYKNLAVEIAQEPDVLAIVHRRDDARELTKLVRAQLASQGIQGEVFHLSALMCPAHRSEVLSQVKGLKKKALPVRLIATQLVEAGVDLDFPVVYRAMGGIDGLAQAAGRCNREGKLLPRLGQLRVFVAETLPPKGVPQTGLKIATSLLKQWRMQRSGSTKGENLADKLNDPVIYQRYFSDLYRCVGDAGTRGQVIQSARERFEFARVAGLYQLIENGWAAPLVVPHGGQVAALVAQLERSGPSRDRLRALQRYTITVPKKLRDAWLDLGLVRWVADTVVVLDALYKSAYDPLFGLLPDRVGAADVSALYIGE